MCEVFGSFRIYGSGLTALRCVSEIHLGVCRKKALAGERMHVCPQSRVNVMFCVAGFRPGRRGCSSARPGPLLFRQKAPKPLTPRLASLVRTDAILRRADQLAPLKQGPPSDESVPALGQTAGVGSGTNSSGTYMKERGTIILYDRLFENSKSDSGGDGLFL